MNLSFDGQPVQIQLKSMCVVLIDPLALDGLSDKLAQIATLPKSEQILELQALGEYGLRIGLQEVDIAGPGFYALGLDSFEPAEGAESDPGVFEIDSGTVVVIDLHALGAVARTLTWDRYDKLLQARPGDDSILEGINEEVGGPRFAIVSADAESPFDGDGAFRLRRTALVPVENRVL